MTSHQDSIWTSRTPYWVGAGYYVPSASGWTMYHEYRDIPQKDKINAILFEKESFFRSIIQQLDGVSAPGGVVFKHPTAGRFSTPQEQLILQKPRAWTRTWTGAGLYREVNNTWINDQSGANVPKDALLFINEEDWIKYKFSRLNPSLCEQSYHTN